ncbi:MAG: xylulokinase [Acidobacteriota bacterium]
MAALFIGIDSGTQGTRAVLVDGDTGELLARRSAQYGLLASTEPGCKEQDPAEWVAALNATIEPLLEAAGPNRRAVAGIGVSGQQHGFVPLDARGRVLRPAKLWCDTTTIAQCQTITSRLGGADRTVELLGNPVLPGYTASKILWLKEQEPEQFARLATVLLPHDYLVYVLTGNLVMECGDASGTALMDVRTRTWCREAVAAVDAGLAPKLPPLAMSTRPAGVLTREVASRWRLGADVLVTGSGDNMMGAIGTGNVREGIFTASFGTSGTLYACSDRPLVDPRRDVATFCDATGRWLLLACTMNVTVATDMVRTLFGWTHEQLAHAAASAPPGSDGLLLLPFFEGERTPNAPDGTGVWIGVRDRTFDAPHMARAAIEGVTMGLNYGLNRLRELGLTPSEIRLTGGGAHNAAWRQIAADIFGCPVVCLAQDEGAAYGAALHAMWVWSHERDEPMSIERLTDRFVTTDESTRAVPNPATRRIYRELQVLFKGAANDLAPSFLQHRRIIGGL